MIKVKQLEFITALSKAKGFMSKDKRQKEICCVNLLMKDGRLRLSATDGHKLYVCRLECDVDLEVDKFEASIPARFVPALLTTLQKNVLFSPMLQVTISLEGNRIGFNAVETFFCCDREIRNYPDIERVIPKESELSFGMSAVQLKAMAEAFKTKQPVEVFIQQYNEGTPKAGEADGYAPILCKPKGSCIGGLDESVVIMPVRV
jgi:DNA polymerase III sliding clamp (beta) subunit (PCNA family)